MLTGPPDSNFPVWVLGPSAALTLREEDARGGGGHDHLLSRRPSTEGGSVLSARSHGSSADGGVRGGGGGGALEGSAPWARVTPGAGPDMSLGGGPAATGTAGTAGEAGIGDGGDGSGMLSARSDTVSYEQISRLAVAREMQRVQDCAATRVQVRVHRLTCFGCS